MPTIVIVSQRQEEERDFEIFPLSFMEECFYCVVRQTSERLEDIWGAAMAGVGRSLSNLLIVCGLKTSVLEVNVWAERR